MTRARCDGRSLEVASDREVIVEVVALADSLLELAELSRRTGDSSTALVAQDAAEMFLALLDGLYWISGPDDVRQVH